MHKDYWRKGLVIGIIVLFVGTSVVPTIGCVFTSERLFTANKINDGSTLQDKVLSDRNFLNNLTVHVVTDKTVYKRFEPVEVTISVTNNGDDDWTYVFPDTQVADFDIGRYYWWSRDKYFAQVLTPVTIRSGETKVLLRTYWNQFSNLYCHGWFIRLPVPPGNYTIRGWIAFSKLYPTPPFGYSEPFTISRLIKNPVSTNYPLCEKLSVIMSNTQLFKKAI